MLVSYDANQFIKDLHIKIEKWYWIINLISRLKDILTSDILTFMTLFYVSNEFYLTYRVTNWILFCMSKPDLT